MSTDLMSDGYFERRIPRLTTDVEARALQHMLDTMKPAADKLRREQPDSEVLAEVEADLRTLAAALAEYDIRKGRG